MPLVSAIMPIYNPRPDHLDEALSSVAIQSVKDVEAVVVNDGSTERSFYPVLEKHRAIGRIVEQRNSGVAGARNAGLAAARGEYVAFLDQDDRWLPGKLEKQLEALRGDQTVDVVVHPVNYIDGEGSPRAPNASRERRIRRRMRSKDTLAALLRGNFIYSPSVLCKRSCFDATGGFDSTVDPHDDWDMWLRLALAGFKFKALDEPLADWRIHSGNTSRDRARMLRTRIAVVDKLEASGLLPGRLRPVLERTRAECHVTLAHHLYKERRYRGFRDEIRRAARIDWRAPLTPKIVRRWCRSLLLEEAS